MVLKFSLKCGLPHSSMAEMLNMINNMFTKPIVPDTRYKIDQIFNSSIDVTYHGTYPTCEN